MEILIVLNRTNSCMPVIEHDYLIGVDGGCRWCIDNRQHIDLAIGDFDSLNGRDFKLLSGHADIISRYPQDKDHTDFELALQASMKKCPSAITVYGVWGGRMDHSMANILCLALQTEQTPVNMPGHDQSGYLIKNQQTIQFETEIGQSISILALCCDCTGVSNRGLEYPLSQATVKQGTGLGLSNVTTQKHCEISLQKGILLVITRSDSKAVITNLTP